MDKKEVKVQKSKGRARTVQERSKAWDELNKKMMAKQARKEALEKENREDVEGNDEVQDDVEILDAPAAVISALPIPARLIPLPEPAEDEEEML